MDNELESLNQRLTALLGRAPRTESELEIAEILEFEQVNELERLNQRLSALFGRAPRTESELEIAGKLEFENELERFNQRLSALSKRALRTEIELEIAFISEFKQVTELNCYRKRFYIIFGRKPGLLSQLENSDSEIRLSPLTQSKASSVVFEKGLTERFFDLTGKWLETEDNNTEDFIRDNLNEIKNDLKEFLNVRLNTNKKSRFFSQSNAEYGCIDAIILTIKIWLKVNSDCIYTEQLRGLVQDLRKKLDSFESTYNKKSNFKTIKAKVEECIISIEQLSQGNLINDLV